MKRSKGMMSKKERRTGGIDTIYQRLVKRGLIIDRRRNRRTRAA